MSEHPIGGLMLTAMSSIKDMIDVDTIIGKPIENGNITIIPISKVGFGFAAGGSEFTCEPQKRCSLKNEETKYELPFGGGSGAGVSINPIGFICINHDNEQPVRFISVEHECSLDKLLEYVPDLIDRVTRFAEKMYAKKDDQQNDVITNNIRENKN